MSEILSKENRIAIAGNKALTLIRIEVNEMRQVTFMPNFKESVKESLEKLYDFYEIQDEVKTIQKIYDFVEKQAAENKEFDAFLGSRDRTEEYNTSIEKSFNVYEKLHSFMDQIYYVCQSYANEKYPLYELETPFYEITHKWAELASIPIYKAISITQKKDNFDLEHNRRIYELKDLTNNDWFERNKEQFKQYDWFHSHSKIRQDFIDSYFNPASEEEIEANQKAMDEARAKFELRRLMRKRDTPEAKKGNEYSHKWQVAEGLLLEDGNYNKENKSFTSLNYIGLKRLIKEEFLHGRDKKEVSLVNDDFSTHITNKKLIQFMDMFPELGLCGKLKETEDKYDTGSSPNRFKDKDGNITYSKTKFGDIIYDELSIKVSEKAKWSSEEQNHFEQIVKIFQIEHICTYDEKGNPEIKL